MRTVRLIPQDIAARRPVVKNAEAEAIRAIKKSLAKLAPNYQGPEVVGRQVLAVVNFPPRQIGKHQSEVLTLGVPDESGNVVLLRPDRGVPDGGKMH